MQQSVQSTEFSPFEVLFGRVMKTATDIILAPATGFTDVDDYISQLLPKLELIREIAKSNCEKHQTEYRGIYDRNTKEINLRLGSKHWLFMPQPKKEQIRNSATST